MKVLGSCTLLVTLLGAASLMGCKPAAITSGMSNLDCSQCHSGNTSSTYGMEVLANEQGDANSGHHNGPRIFNTPTMLVNSGNIYTFSGSNSSSENSASCSQCHTDQGFVNWLTTGTAGAQDPASPPSCFTCHNPHVTGNFSLRTQGAFALIDGTIYNYGAGNLCVNCHHARTASTAVLTGGTVTWSGSTGPHHGVQSDMLLARNNWASGLTYVGVSAHATTAVDSCVSCHHFAPASGNTGSGSPQLGGHGFYLAAQVGSVNVVAAETTYAEKDDVALCKTCHTGVGASFPTFNPAPADWAAIGAGKDKLVEIRALRDKLVVYFANAANFAGTGGVAPILVASGSSWNGTTVPTWPTTIEWNRDFVYNSASAKLTAAQSESFWNLKLYLEDRSNGVHNATFAAEILYDACTNVGIAVGATRP